MLSIPVLPIVALILLTAGLGVAVAVVVVRQPLWAIPAGLGGVLGLVMLAFGPSAPAVPPGEALQNFGGVANFKDRYDQARDLYGEPIGHCGELGGLLSCYTTYTQMTAHPETRDPYYQIENSNLGLELAQNRGIPLEANPVVPPVVASYLASLANRNVDLLYWVGHARTSPLKAGETFQMYFDKTVLTWPADSDDPGLVKREPVGVQIWAIRTFGQDLRQPEEWTLQRRLLLGAATIPLFISGLPVLFRRFFQSVPVADF